MMEQPHNIASQQGQIQHDTTVHPAILAGRRRFLELIPGRISKLEDLAQIARSNGADFKAVLGIADVAHMLSGTAQTLAMEQIGALSSTLEDQIRHDIRNGQTPEQVFARAEPVMDNLLDMLEEQYFE
jgi:HPt (histidine-containing phosphotransfer) domain-containing protein